jgi:hypothetical protein
LENPFERFEIDHLSASSLNLYAEEPAFWTLIYLHKFQDERGADAWRGHAVEAGLDHWLYKRDAPQALLVALNRFEEQALGDLDDKVDRERGKIRPMLERACEALQGYREPIARQLRIEHRFEGIEVPVIGYVDYEWEDEGLDLKTTSRMPTEMPPRHARQIGLYSVARKRPYSALYVTDKKACIKSVDEPETHVKRLEWYAHSVRRLLSVFPDKHEASRIFAPHFDSFYWKHDTAKEAAKEIWECQT